MKYMLLVYMNEGAMTQAEREACFVKSAQLSRELHANGQYIDASPLHPVAAATSVRIREGKRLVTDGPFAETHEQLGGFYLVDAKDLDEAIAIAARIPPATVGTIEIRPVLQISGLPEDKPAPPTLAITRVFNAPRSVVFAAWTKPEQLQHWQAAPRGFTVTAEQTDIRPGGVNRICMRSPEGIDHRLQTVYREIVEPERLVFTHTWLDADGKPGKETLVTITFADKAGKTELALQQTGFASAQARDGHKAGWASALDGLADYLEKSQGRGGRS